MRRKESLSPLDLLRPLAPRVHYLLYLPLVGLVQDHHDNRYPQRHLPAFAPLLLGSPVLQTGGVVAVPTGRVSQGVPHSVEALLTLLVV